MSDKAESFQNVECLAKDLPNQIAQTWRNGDHASAQQRLSDCALTLAMDQVNKTITAQYDDDRAAYGPRYADYRLGWQTDEARQDKAYLFRQTALDDLLKQVNHILDPEAPQK
jgi:hypothetical protein